MMISVKMVLIVTKRLGGITTQTSKDNGLLFSATDAKERQQWVDRLRSTSEHHASFMTPVSLA